MRSPKRPQNLSVPTYTPEKPQSSKPHLSKLDRFSALLVFKSPSKAATHHIPYSSSVLSFLIPALSFPLQSIHLSCFHYTLGNSLLGSLEQIIVPTSTFSPLLTILYHDPAPQRRGLELGKREVKRLIGHHIS